MFDVSGTLDLLQLVGRLRRTPGASYTAEQVSNLMTCSPQEASSALELLCQMGAAYRRQFNNIVSYTLY